MTPVVGLALGIVFVVVLIAVFKIHPFIALLLAAIAVNVASSGKALQAVEAAAADFGATVGAIGIVIVLAAIVGHCLLASGAADRITRALLALAGEKRAASAFLASGYALSIPVFFDTVFFLLIPLVRALHRKTGRDYALCVMAVCAGAVVTHSLAPPTPGPLIMVETLPGLNLGTALVLGTLLGIAPAAIGGLFYGGVVNRSRAFRSFIPFGGGEDGPEVPIERLPGLGVSLLPLALPVLLISGDAFLQGVGVGIWDIPSPVLAVSAFFGNRNIALLLAAFAAMATLKRTQGLPMARLKEDLEPALMTGAMIVMITSAGGAFGKALANLRIGDSLGEALGGSSGGAAPLILLAWGLAAILKTAQGSGTVSMITASAILAGALGSGPLPCHPIYVFAAIGFGSLSLSWMNDSGFWVVGKMSGFDERQTFQVWTLLLLVISVVGLAEILLLVLVLPFR